MFFSNSKSSWKAVCSAAMIESVVKNEHDLHSKGILKGSYESDSFLSSSWLAASLSVYFVWPLSQGDNFFEKVYKKEFFLK